MALPQSSCARVPDDAFAFRLRWDAFEDATGLAPGQPHPPARVETPDDVALENPRDAVALRRRADACVIRRTKRCLSALVLLAYGLLLVLALFVSDSHPHVGTCADMLISIALMSDSHPSLGRPAPRPHMGTW